jgi:RluA family pseudouridine synthase
VTFTVLLEDADLVAVAKPAGLTVIPARDEPPADALRQQLEAARSEKLWVVHRLDRDTSGVVLFARNADAHRALSIAFEKRAVRKQYVAWTRGVLSGGAGVVGIALHTARKGKMRPARKGEAESLPSETAWRVTAQTQTDLGPVARVEVEPHTGRQHQIRVHLRFLGTPLLVDPLYGACEAVSAGELGAGSPAITRLSLHASLIAFEHPTTHEAITINAPLADDLAALDAWLFARGARGQ